MSDTNGHTNGEATTVLTELKEVRQRLQLARAKRALHHEERREKRIRESFLLADMATGYSDLLDRMRTTDGRLLLSPSTVNHRLYGRNWPHWSTWQEHALMRAQARFLYDTSDIAQGALNGLCCYVMGKGIKYRPTARKGKTPPPELLQSVQNFIDAHVKRNNLNRQQRECFIRSRRDGEFFSRLYFYDDGTTDVRIIEPEQVMDKPGARLEEWSFGVQNPVTWEHDRVKSSDVQTRTALWVCYGGNNSDGEIVPAEEMIFYTSENTDLTIKRGMSDISYECYEAIKGCGRSIGNMVEAAAVQSAITEIRQHEGPTTADVAQQQITANEDDYDTLDMWTGDSVPNQKRFPGTRLDIPKGFTYVPPPFSEGGPTWIQITQAGLRRVATRWNAPEWLPSADASDHNYSNALVVESPFHRRCEQWQGDLHDSFERMVLPAVKWAADHGLIVVAGVRWTWKMIDNELEIVTEFAALLTRNPLEQSQQRQIEVQNSVMSPQQWCQQEGRDYEQTQAEIEEHRERTGEAGGMPPMPGMDQGGGGPPQPGAGQGGGNALAGLLGEAIREACTPNAQGGGAHDEHGRPCSAGSKDTPGNSWADRAKALPAAVLGKVREKVKAKYQQLEHRYGRKLAISIMAAGIAGVPVPIPGASLLTAAPVIAAAEAVRYFRGKPREEAPPEELSAEEVERLGKEWLEALVKEWASEEGLQEGCVPNQSGQGHHDSQTGHPCSTGSDGKSADLAKHGLSPMMASKATSVAKKHGVDPEEVARDAVALAKKAKRPVSWDDLEKAANALKTSSPSKPASAAKPADKPPEPITRKSGGADEMSGHPLANMANDQKIQTLAAQTRHDSNANPRGYTGEFPKGIDGEKFSQKVASIVADVQAKNSLERPTIRKVYDLAKADLPGMSLDEFQQGLAAMHKQRAIRLDPFTQALATHPDLNAIMPLDRENKYYVDLPIKGTSESCTPNKSGQGHHDTQTGHPCSTGGTAKQPHEMDRGELEKHVAGLRDQLKQAEELLKKAAPAPAPAPTAGNEAPHVAVQKAFAKLEKDHHGMVPLAALKAATGLPLKQLHDAINYWRREGVLSGVGAEGKRAGLTAADREAAIPDPSGQLITHVMKRE